MRCRICDASSSGLSNYNVDHPFTTHFMSNKKDTTGDLCFACWACAVDDDDDDEPDFLDEDFDDE